MKGNSVRLFIYLNISWLGNDVLDVINEEKVVGWRSNSGSEGRGRVGGDVIGF